MVITSYKSKVDTSPTATLVRNQGQILAEEAAILTTKLQIDAILPLSQKELEQAKKDEANEKKSRGRTKK